MRQKGNHRCVFAFQVEEINKWTCNSNWRTIKHLWGAHQEKLRLSCRAPRRASLLLDCLVFLLTPSLALVVQLCPVGDEEDGCGKGLCVWSDTHKPAGVCVCVCVCVCECTCTRAQLTQSEKCCMATVHKGTRLCIRMCQVCLYVWKKERDKDGDCVHLCACLSVLGYLCALHRQTLSGLCIGMGFCITPYIFCAHAACWTEETDAQCVSIRDTVITPTATATEEHRY